MKPLTQTDLRALAVLLQWDGWWDGYDDLAEATRRPVPALRASLKRLRDRGLAYYSHTEDEDSRITGSGTFIDPITRGAIQRRRKARRLGCPEYDVVLGGF